MSVEMWLWAAAACVWLLTSCVVGLLVGLGVRRREAVDQRIRELRFGSPRSITEPVRH